MKCLLLLALVATAIGVGSAVSHIEATAYPDNGYVAAETEVTVVCKITDLKPGETLVWQQGADEDSLVVIGAANVMSKEGYTVAAPETEGDVYIYTLTIPSATAEDAGVLRCFIGEVRGDASITITEPISEMHLIRIDTFSGEEHELNDFEVLHIDGEQHDFKLKCSATANPAPTLVATFGGQDITENFDYATEGNTATLISQHMRQLEEDEHRKQFVCTASVPMQESKTITVTPVFRTAASLDCENTMASYYVNNVVLHCVMDADPAPTVLYFSWEQDNTKTVLGVGETKSGFSMDKEARTDGQYNVTLTVNRTTPNTFRTYTLHAQNELNAEEVTATVSLEHDPNDKTGESKGASSVVGPISLLLLITSWLSFHLTH